MGRTYQDVIRVNSQSGKGGVAYVLKNSYGLNLPRRLQVEFSQIIQSITDEGGEILPERIKATFDETYLNTESPLAYLGHRSNFDSSSSSESEVTARVRLNGSEIEVSGLGNGPLSAFKHALEMHCGINVHLADYQEHAVGAGAGARAAAYVEIETPDHRVRWGAGIDANIVTASFQALVSAINRAADTLSFKPAAAPFGETHDRKILARHS